jgi:hypothetical protein
MNDRPIRVALFAAAACLSATVGQAATIEMIAPNMPPHFDASGRGRIADVVRAGLDRCGHAVKFTMVPFGRHWKDYADNPAFDGLATAEADQIFPGHTTRPFMHLQDGATVLSDEGLAHITRVDELRGRRVVAFPAADKILGIEAHVPEFRSFSMRAERFDQIRPLLARRADAILADGLITAHFIKLIRDRARVGQEPDISPERAVVFRRIFAVGPQRLYFRERSIAEGFDRCFSELRDSGEVERIAKPYVDRYRDILADQYPNY